ncbi:glycosyltransferase family protein [Mycobacterium lacus]|uniref:Glycosyl transferase family 1 domain-containing protein n=1 Tax=Mycobacterium lacus TaxID=169765 RepID=A0A7I7NNU4_9MYCO|nr:hypothetical protein [Mycobacterium lacus]MCV7122518.1 hypothetical protein [Mycobacterium lacus]BBX97177.1 hypothetical protein MLAC_24710 [Mycobacterium lacus]
MQHSQLQRDYLLRNGIDSARIRPVRPPISVPATAESRLPKPLFRFIAGAEILVFTAAARLDYFKNVELLIDTGIHALEKNIPVRVLIVGGNEYDDARQAYLLSRIRRGIRLIS